MGIDLGAFQTATALFNLAGETTPCSEITSGIAADTIALGTGGLVFFTPTSYSESIAMNHRGQPVPSGTYDFDAVTSMLEGGGRWCFPQTGLGLDLSAGVDAVGSARTDPREEQSYYYPVGSGAVPANREWIITTFSRLSGAGAFIIRLSMGAANPNAGDFSWWLNQGLRDNDDAFIN